MVTRHQQDRTNRKLDEHREAAERENIAFLLDEVGLHPDHVAKRLGMSRSVLDKKIGSIRREQRDSGVVSEDRKGA